jgi:DNA-binding MarR family transcriptional regulator
MVGSGWRAELRLLAQSHPWLAASQNQVWIFRFTTYIIHHMNGLPSPAPRPALKVSLSFLVSQLGTHAAQTFAKVLEPLGLRVQDAGLLRILSARAGMTQIELSETFGVAPSRMVLLLDGLEASGLIERKRDPSDRRRMRVYPSPEGLKTAQTVANLTATMDEGLFRALTPEERAALSDLVSRVVQAQALQAGVHPAYRTILGGEDQQ